MLKAVWNWLFGQRCKSDSDDCDVEVPSTPERVTTPSDLGGPSISFSALMSGQPSTSSSREPGTSSSTLGQPSTSSSSSTPGARGEPARRRVNSSVIQTSVVEDPYKTIPSVTLLLLEDTSDRLSRLMDKLDALEWDSPLPRRKSDQCP